MVNLSGVYLSGYVGGRQVLLRSRWDVERSLDPSGPVVVADIQIVPSKLSWIATDLAVVRDPRNPARRLLLYGDQGRKAIAGVRDDEFAYLLRAELGADEAFHIPARPLPLADSLLLLPDNTLILNAHHPSAHFTSRGAKSLERQGFNVVLAQMFPGVASGDRLFVGEGMTPPAEKVGRLAKSIISIGPPFPIPDGLIVIRGPSAKGDRGTESER